MDVTSIGVFVGVDMAKTEHYAQAVTAGCAELFDRPISNDQAAIEALIDDAPWGVKLNRWYPWADAAVERALASVSSSLHLGRVRREIIGS